MIIKIMTYKVMFVIFTHYDFEIKQMNVKTAFLHSELEEVVYIKQLTEYENKDSSKVCRLNKALYDLKQSSHLWYEVIKNFLVDLEFTHLNMNHSLFQKELLFVAVYIDDLLLCDLHKQQIQRLKNVLNTKFEMTDLSFLKHYLKMQITHNRTWKTLTLTQFTYL